jgi:hypothetical protein
MIVNTEPEAIKQLEDAVVCILEVHEQMAKDMITPKGSIESRLPEILKRARKRYTKRRQARILWETPSIPS